MSKRDNKAKGKCGEEIACAYLKKAGYDIFHKNFSTRLGELDIVAADSSALVFIEVKTRLNDEFGTPAEGRYGGLPQEKENKRGCRTVHKEIQIL